MYFTIKFPSCKNFTIQCTRIIKITTLIQMGISNVCITDGGTSLSSLWTFIIKRRTNIDITRIR